MKFSNVIDVVRWRLCVGCGACASVCPEQRVRLVDVEDEGIRPVVLGSRFSVLGSGKPSAGCRGPEPQSCRGQTFDKEGTKEGGDDQGCEDCKACLEVCPGLCMTSQNGGSDSGGLPGLGKRWGRVLEVWEGHASDPEIRFMGSSGGLCTALSLFCLESGMAGGVLHIGSDPHSPWKNRTVRSTTRVEVVSRTGSRYSPASPCDGLRRMEEAPNQSVFVGKPCDVAGLRMTQQARPDLARKTALAIGFFCAGTPSTRATLELLGRHGVEPEGIADLRYRGMGWPGMATAHRKEDGAVALKLSYQDSWGFVQKYRPFRCYFCPDLTAEFADISVGDPWYRELGEQDPGRSLILVRTEKGREIFRQAVERGYVTAEAADPEIIYRSQKNLLGKRQAIWGRLLAMRLLGIPRPELKGFHLLENWLDLPGKEKVRSIVGTARRIIQRNYFRPIEYEAPGKAGG